VVLADAEDVEADLIREHYLLDELAHPPSRVAARTNVRKGVEAEFHRGFLSGHIQNKTRTFVGDLDRPQMYITTLSWAEARAMPSDVCAI